MASKRTTIPVLLALMVLMAYGFIFARSPGVEYYWTHPTTGTPVDHYVGDQMLIDGPDTVHIYIEDIPRGDEYGVYTVAYQFGAIIRFRVAGVDSLGRQGVWSPWSDPWIDDGPPDQPGKPSQTLTLKHK